MDSLGLEGTAGDGMLEGADDISVGWLVEADVAVADLHETKVPHGTRGALRGQRADRA